MTSHLQQLFSQALENLGITDHSAIQLEHPADTTHGDYSTNVAMQLFSQIKNKVEYTNPRELAQGIVEHASKLLAGDDSFTGLSGCIKEISVAGPGFINISFRDAFFVSQLSTILEKGTTFGTNQSLKGKTVVVEYTDPNPFKEFHIGHLYSNIVGESIARLFENSGATVVRADFFGDVGMHAAKSLWGLLQNFADDEIDLENLAAMPLKERIAYLGKSYARGATAYKEDEAAAESIKQLNFLLFKAAQEIV
ncbi:arginine--tRNA ligase, partial [Candidatus Woesebacteria bacterium]|nr:arginine--tRNA ligase [Candidatus Woesebacteria bacterium]